MKRPDNTEMDRLLRRFAGRGGETLPARTDASRDAVPGTTHLDADELSAYAEGALPEAARSRYFAHLADCDTCRKIVTGLALQSVAQDEAQARVVAAGTPPRKSWRERLAMIFSPPVLRYGVPALALFAVIVVAILATRTRRDEGFVAQNKEEARSAASEMPANANAAAQPFTAGPAAGENHATSNVASNTAFPSEPTGSPLASASATPPLPAKTARQEQDAPLPPPKPAESEPAVAQSREEKRIDIFGGGKRGQEEQPTTVAPPPSNSPVLAAPAETENTRRDKREEDQKKTKAPAKDDTDETVAIDRNSSVDGILNKAEANEDRRRETPSTAGATQSARRSRPSATAKSGAADTGPDKERSAETSSVGGRRFYRQGGAWIDTGYSSSQPTTNIHRGSEQYRALVADEPGLRSIVEHFRGEVIVVWKSRAYRFY